MMFHILQIDNFYGYNFAFIIVSDALVDCACVAASNDIIEFVTVGSHPFFGIFARGDNLLFDGLVLIEGGIGVNDGLLFENNGIFCGCLI